MALRARWIQMPCTGRSAMVHVGGPRSPDMLELCVTEVLGDWWWSWGHPRWGWHESRNPYDSPELAQKGCETSIARLFGKRPQMYIEWVVVSAQ